MSKRKDGLTPEEIAQLVEEYKKRKEQRMQGQQPDNQPAADSEGEENTPENQDEGEETALSTRTSDFSSAVARLSAGTAAILADEAPGSFVCASPPSSASFAPPENGCAAAAIGAPSAACPASIPRLCLTYEFVYQVTAAPTIRMQAMMIQIRLFFIFPSSILRFSYIYLITNKKEREYTA